MALKTTSIGMRFQKACGHLFSSLPFSANQITIGALLFALVGFYLAYARQFQLSLLFFILSGVADAIDGAVARARKEVSARGAYIDGVTDRLVEFLFILSFVFFALPDFAGVPMPLALVSFLFFGSCMTGFATAYADHRKVADDKKIARQPGILPRAERLAFLFLAFALAPYCAQCASALLTAGAALCIITFAQRAAYFAG